MALAAELKGAGISFCDAPLGGTPAQAEEGKLSAIVGCDAEVWPRLEGVIGKWAAKAVRVGVPGDGHKMKLLMNFCAMGYAAIYSEALAVAQKVGLSPQTFDSGIRGSRMDCGFYQTFFSYVLDRNRDAHKFTLKNAHKDMKYLAAMAQSAGVANPVGGAVKNYFAMAEAAGLAEDFVPMLSDFVAGPERHCARRTEETGSGIAAITAGHIVTSAQSALGSRPRAASFLFTAFHEHQPGPNDPKDRPVWPPSRSLSSSSPSPTRFIRAEKRRMNSSNGPASCSS